MSEARSVDEIRELFLLRGYRLLSTEYFNTHTQLIFEKDGYKYKNTYNGFMKTENPKKWGKNNPFSMENISVWLKQNDARCVLDGDIYDSKSIPLKCSCGNRYSVSMSNLVTNHQFSCPSCGRKSSQEKHMKTKRFVGEMERRGLTLLEPYTVAKQRYYMMTHDGYYIKSSPWNIANGADERDTIFDVCNQYSIDNMRHWLELNSPSIRLVSTEYLGAKKKYLFRCSCGDEFETNWQYVVRDNISRCPKCSQKESGLELKTKQWLDENGIEYFEQQTFDGCRDKRLLRFDFYLPLHNLLIEVDGQQHFTPRMYGNMSLSEAAALFESGRRRDSIKDEFCKENGYKLLRIPYTEYRTDKYKEILKASTTKI